MCIPLVTLNFGEQLHMGLLGVERYMCSPRYGRISIHTLRQLHTEFGHEIHFLTSRTRCGERLQADSFF